VDHEGVVAVDEVEERSLVAPAQCLDEGGLAFVARRAGAAAEDSPTLSHGADDVQSLPARRLGPGLGLAEVALERRAHVGAGAVQEHPLVPLAEPEGLADLLGGPALDVAQQDDVALAGGQLVHRLARPGQRLARQQALLRKLVPALRRIRPVP
jgi:hypothetical protein